MKKAELEQRLAKAEFALNAILEICDRSDKDVLKEFNEDSMERIGKEIYDIFSVYPLKVGMIQAEAEYYFDGVK